MQRFKTARDIIIDDADISNAVPYLDGRVTWVAKVANVVTAEEREPCGQCEECYSNGMPHYCESPVWVIAHYYRQVNWHTRLYPTEGGYFVTVNK